ncbi:MAG: hypothetical protein K6T61_02225 [Bryobacteraceae bacterium]|nr:hypothetical protein [Bryobacteraceae bacterium]
MARSSVADLLAEAEALKRSFDGRSAQRLGKLLAALSRRKFTEAADLHRYHELLLYCRAFPQNPDLLSQCEELLAGFAELAERWVTSGGDSALFDEPEASGVAGTSFTAIFSYHAALRLARLEPERLRLDWDAWEPSDRTAETWRWLFPLVEEDTLVEPHIPYKDWLLAAAGSEERALSCLLERLHSLPAPEKQKAGLYAALELPLRWDLEDSRLSRTLMRGPMEEPFFHEGPLIPRSEVCLERELTSPPIELEPLSEEAGEAFLNMALAASAVRQRELHGFTYGDPRSVVRARLGRGVDVYLCGVPVGSRLPLRAYHAGMLVKNGVPIGYVETLSLCDRMEVGFNLYYTFREGETAWLFARLLGLLHQALGVTCFVIDPYQIGRGNEEAIQSGAFWFYRKLGFRPVLPDVVRVLEPEECRMLGKPGYRSRPAVLRKLAAGPLVFEADGHRGAWDRFHVRNIGLAAQQLRPLEALAEASQALGIQAGPHGEYASLAQVLALIPGLKDWPAEDKASLIEIIRAKMGPDESVYVRRTQQHARLREALLGLGTHRSSASVHHV